ncbi:MAG: DUF192 domain-containing protein [Zoogloeaceae bacterium]|nr:DUF192 domain-containing protein [Zoogloeaceae bacterium]
MSPFPCFEKFTAYGFRAALVLFLFFSLPARAAPPFALSQTISIGFYQIDVEVAASLEERVQGLMRRMDMPENAGMLFIFPQIGQHCMWMKNTRIPLSVAFLDSDGYVINMHDMQPESTVNHCADRPARYALEMNRGWFAKRGIDTGTRVVGITHIPIPLR